MNLNNAILIYTSNDVDRAYYNGFNPLLFFIFSQYFKIKNNNIKILNEMSLATIYFVNQCCAKR